MCRRPRRSFAMLALGCTAGCCSCPPPAQSPPEPVAPPAVVEQPLTAATPLGPGPTAMARVTGGYELRNKAVRIVIDGRTGDVVLWGTPRQRRNTVAGPRGLYATIAGLPDVPPVGYVEKRDDQTWQYYGTDANGVAWRKLYNLDQDSLLVSYVIQNNRPAPLLAVVQVRGELPNLRITDHTPEQFTGNGGYGTVMLHGWNRDHAGPPPVPPVLLQSDPFHLRPGEREGYTTQWQLWPLGGP